MILPPLWYSFRYCEREATLSESPHAISYSLYSGKNL